MRKVAILLAVAVTGCLRSTAFQQCATDPDCTGNGIAGHCEAASGACSADDGSCDSGRRYQASAGALAGTCVAVSASADARPDGLDVSPDASPASGRECIAGIALPASYSACAADVCAIDASCCSATWSDACVQRAEHVCHRACSGMAFVGGEPGSIVVELATRKVLAAINDEGIRDGAWADYDGDGLADLATVGFDRIRVFHSGGRTGDVLALGTALDAAASDQLGRPLDGSGVVWTDLDRDGHLDVVAVGGEAAIQIRWDANAHAFGAPHVVAESTTRDPLALTSAAVVDLDADGYPDLVVGAWKHPARAYHNDHGVLTDSGWRLAEDWLSVTSCDLGGTATPELVITGEASDVRTIAAGVPGTANPLPAGLAWQAACGDLDGDGTRDLIVAGSVTPTRVVPNPTGNLGTWTTGWQTADATDQHGVALGDLDGDGRLEGVAVVDGSAASHDLQLVVYALDQPAPSVSMQATTYELTGFAQHGRSIALAPLPP